MPRKRPEVEEWVVVPNWETFQHYSDRAPKWIKLHASLLMDDDFANLTEHLRLVLILGWLVYSNDPLGTRADPASFSRRTGVRVTRADLESLNRAGFLELTASKPLAPRKQNASPREEKRREEGFASARGSKATPEKWNGTADVGRLGVCPECGIGGDLHVPDCSHAVHT